MKHLLLPLGILVSIFSLVRCGAPSQPNNTQTAAVPVPKDPVPEFRKVVSKESIAAYQEKTDNPLNNWYFSVKLYETPKTFAYLIRMQFEEVRGEDTIWFPDLGIAPRPVIKKGKDKYSCIVGFTDVQDSFREYKMVYVKDGQQLKLVTLRHYAMVNAP